MNWKKLYRNAFAPWVIIFGGTFLMVYVFRGPSGRYVVIKKENNKIVYYSTYNPNFLHTMTFDDSAKSTGFYKYINVGDTITGTSRRLNKFVSESNAAAGCAIEAVNGKNLLELQEIARRDSMMHRIKTKQK